jgi:3-oxoacyl-[acyl-carrier protein] reductase
VKSTRRGRMDLGLKGRTAIVCAASQGLGKASAMSLAREGVNIAARRGDVLARVADEIASATGNRPKTVIADVTTKESRDAILAACPAPDILVNNAGGPPPRDFRKFERDDWIKALDGNMLAPIALIKATLDGMIARKFGRIVNVTSHAVKAPVAMLALSNGARTGLTGFVAGLARSTAEHNVTINNLLPGTFDTDRLKSNLAALAKNSSREVGAVTEEIRTANPTKRFGHPDESARLARSFARRTPATSPGKIS